MHRRGRRGAEEGRREDGGGGGGLVLRSATEILRAYRTWLNVSLREDERGRLLSHLLFLLRLPLFTTVPSDARISRHVRVRSLTFACYYAAI